LSYKGDRDNSVYLRVGRRDYVVNGFEPLEIRSSLLTLEHTSLVEATFTGMALSHFNRYDTAKLNALNPIMTKK
ncbi:MAG: hypothetical protein Q8O46_00675, partial [bacterium]|nr:hypothetical protein [bacterium]